MIDSTHSDDEVVGPSDRSFGLVFGVLSALVGLFPLWRGDAPRLWALVFSGTFLLLAAARPRTLAPANRAWLRIGLAMHRVVNPVVMAFLFYLVVTPFGLVTRWRHTGLARRLRRDPGAHTYWIVREEGFSRMDQQF